MPLLSREYAGAHGVLCSVRFCLCPGFMNVKGAIGLAWPKCFCCLWQITRWHIVILFKRTFTKERMQTLPSTFSHKCLRSAFNIWDWLGRNWLSQCLHFNFRILSRGKNIEPSYFYLWKTWKTFHIGTGTYSVEITCWVCSFTIISKSVFAFNQFLEFNYFLFMFPKSPYISQIPLYSWNLKMFLLLF